MQNYKVFVNNSLIFFGSEQEFSQNDKSLSDFQQIEPAGIQLLTEKIKNNINISSFWVETNDVKKSFIEFEKYFTLLKAAGGLVLNNKNEILMIHRFKKWDFPKGKVEENEGIEEAAIREVMEETAVAEIQIDKKLPNVYHIYRYNDKWILKETHWYLMRSTYSGKLSPQFEEDILAAVWVPIPFMNEYMVQSYPGLRELVMDCGINQSHKE